MFAEMLLDSQRMDRSRRGWATLTSFGVQAIAVTSIMMLSLISTQVMPLALPPTIVLTVPHSDAGPAPQPQQPPAGNLGAGTGYHGAAWIVPTHIPDHVYTGPDVGPVAPDIGPIGLNPAGPYIPGAIGPGPAPFIPRGPDSPRLLKISHMSEGSILYRVEPVYPAIAKAAGVQGPVELAAIIGRDGRIENLQVLRGHPLLVKAAVDAVSTWRYRPYVLNDQPVEVETRITVNFILAR